MLCVLSGTETVSLLLMLPLPVQVVWDSENLHPVHDTGRDGGFAVVSFRVAHLGDDG